MPETRAEYNESMKAYMKERYYKRKAACIAKLGGKCVKCGVVDDLEFDHIDPETKTFTIGNKLASVNESLLQEELKKCQLLCVNCHETKSVRDMGYQDAKNSHGTISSYKYCKCVLCKAAKQAYMQKYAKRSAQLRKQGGLKRTKQGPKPKVLLDTNAIVSYTLKPKDPITLICEACHKSWSFTPTTNKRPKYCSPSCRSKTPNRKRVAWPHPEELQKQVNELGTSVVAAQLGVTTYSVTRVLRKNGLEFIHGNKKRFGELA